LQPSSEEARLWCDDPTINVSMAAIAESLSSAAFAFRHWLDVKLAAFGFFGWCSIVERSGETCVAAGLLLASFLLSKHTHGPAKHAFVRDNLIPAILTFVRSAWNYQAICIGIAFVMTCITMQDTHVMYINLDWTKATRRDEGY
jgi:hypothetical protein